jgi:Aspartyl protease
MRAILVVTTLFCVYVSSCFAQNSPSSNKPLEELSYHPVGHLIYLPVRINGAGPYIFCFDTGAPNSIVDSTLAQKLNIQALTKDTIHGAGKGEVAAGDAGEVEITVGGLTTHVPHAKIVDLSKVPVPEKMDGLAGAEFLEQYIVRIDPVQHKIAFYDPQKFTYRGGGKAVSLELTNSRLYVRVGLAVKPGEVVERRVRVDTGSEDSVDDDLIRQSAHTGKTTVGNGLGTSYEDVSGVYDTVTLGPFSSRVGPSWRRANHRHGADAALHADI